jgi:hypothetical protein
MKKLWLNFPARVDCAWLRFHGWHPVPSFLTACQGWQRPRTIGTFATTGAIARSRFEWLWPFFVPVNPPSKI